MSNFTPLLLFGVNVELSSLLSVSFNVDLLSGPWSIGKCVQPGDGSIKYSGQSHWHGSVRNLVSWCCFDFRCEQINDYQVDDQVQRDRGCQRSCQEIVSTSPDLSPIEHLWDQLCRAVRGHLRQFLHEEWAMIPHQSITTLVGSTRKRLAECIASREGPTHYWNCIPINDKS